MQVIDNDTPGTVEELTLSGNQATTSLSLYASRSYTFLFWADDGQSYTYIDNLTDIALNGTPTGTQAEIAYAACIDWDKSATINATLKHAVSKVTLKTTNNVEAGKTLTLTVPHAVTGYNAQTGKATGTPAEYEHSITTTAISGATETTPKELFSFYILAADELQTLTIESNEGENTVPANLSGGKHIVLTGDIGNIANERPTSANLTVTVGEWGDQQLHPFGGKDQLTDATTASEKLQGAGTETETAVGTSVLSGIQGVGKCTDVGTFVMYFRRGILTTAVATYHCNLGFFRFHCQLKYVGNLLHVGTRTMQACQAFLFCCRLDTCFCKVATTGITATTAVGSCQCRFHFINQWIFFYFEFLGNKIQDNCQNSSHDP